MRKIIVSTVAATVLVLALMVFVETSMAFRPDVIRPVADQLPIQLGDEPAPPLPGRNVSLRGTIASLPADESYAGTWDIEIESGDVISVEVTDETVILPPGVTPEVEDSVHVLARAEGEEGEETLAALKITVEKAQSRWGRPHPFRGEIEVLPADYMSGTWQVSGISVTVDAKTMIHPPDRTPELGMMANVVAFEQSDGTLWAMNISLQTPEEAEAEVEFEGPIDDLPEDPDFLGTWVVDGISVTVTADTELEGAEPAVGLIAEVEGYEEDGSIIATKIKVEEPEYEEMEFEATLVSTDVLPSEWVFDTEPMSETGEISVTVTSSTTINTDKGPLEIGCWVEVEALKLLDGTLVAIRIKVEDDPDADNEVEFTAPIAELPSSGPEGFIGQWVFATEPISTTVVVTPNTEVEGDPEVGLEAEVKGFLQGDGFVHAESIKIED